MGVTVETVGADLLGKLVDSLTDVEQEITIGLHEDAEPYPDGTDVVQVGAAHEFGTSSIPARPFLRGYFDSGGMKELGDAARDMLGKVADGSVSPDDVGEEVGKVGVEGVKARIESGIDPPLAPATLADPDRDSRGIPLLDTGHMLSQIKSKAKRT